MTKMFQNGEGFFFIFFSVLLVSKQKTLTQTHTHMNAARAHAYLLALSALASHFECVHPRTMSFGAEVIRY